MRLPQQVVTGDMWYFRIRSVPDGEGGYEGMYGKIYGEIPVITEAGLFLTLPTYFLNPTFNDRNMEFDTSRNRASEFVIPRWNSSAHLNTETP